MGQRVRIKKNRGGEARNYQEKKEIFYQSIS